MTTAREVPDPWSDSRGTRHWVPSRGLTNGLNARAWGVLADLTESQVYRVLFALTDAGIAGYVLPVRTTVLERGDPDVVWRLWVDLPQYRAAEDLLMELLRYGRPRRRPTPLSDHKRARRMRVRLVRKSP
ncbi:MAG: hypothetical protein JWN03_1034 [Nocardia sp.]|uniref:hypothetical protein n=1 Tax=Nocardia sp. TaxID=1821 RepID=UPI00262510D6|nr:hypothetical protein [Nocardia sp.]MCU1640759.1 hypothetical protein [Nocardia sp.]